MAYALENAIYQWEDGERRVRETPEPDRARLERALFAVLDELRRRLGSAFSVEELAELYNAGTDWATEVAAAEQGGYAASTVVDAAFRRYAQMATDYAGGRRQGAGG